ncbi:unnamed protein product [Effrenium voratum]|nr:unnamed protein product [Effrenium voratum]
MLYACVALPLVLRGHGQTLEQSPLADACFLQLQTNVSASETVEIVGHAFDLNSSAGSGNFATPARVYRLAKPLEPHAPRVIGSFLIFVACACAALWAAEICGISCASCACAESGRRAGQFAYLATSLLISVSHSLLLTVSLPLSAELGFSAAASGVLSSCPCLGGLLAQCLVIFARALLAQSFRGMRFGVALGLFLQAMAYVGFVLALWLPQVSNVSTTLVFALLVGFRSLGGFFGALANLSASWLAFEMTPSQELMDLQTANQACFGLGHCLGAVTSSLALVFLFHLSGMEQSSEIEAGAAPAMLFIALNVLLLAVVMLFVPRELEAGLQAECKKAAPEPSETLTLNESDQQVVFRTGVIYNIERSFSVGGIEVATTMISEVEFGFSPLTTGWIFGFIALASAVTNIMVAFSPAKIDSRSHMMLFQAGVGVLMSPFILDWWPWWSLYVADVLIMTLTNTANGIADGLVIMGVGPQGQGVSRQSYVNLKMLSMGAARLLAAPFVRGTVDTLGRNGYGVMQLLITLMGFCSIWKMHGIVSRKC